MKQRLLWVAVWLLGLIAGWTVFQATANRPAPFPADRGLVGYVGTQPLVAVAEAVGKDSRGWPLFTGPVEVWDVDAGRRVAIYSVVSNGWQFNAWNAGRWMRVLPVGPDGLDGLPVLIDLADGQEVCHAPAPIYWSIPQESGGRVTILAIDNPSGDYRITAYDPTSGAAVWTAGEYPSLVAGNHVVTSPFNLKQSGSPSGPWTVRRSTDGATLGVITGPYRPLATDGRSLLTDDGRMWDVDTATPRFKLTGIGTDQQAQRPWITPDGRLLVVLRDTTTGPAVCWHDTDTGSEEQGRRLSLPSFNRPALWVRPDGRAQVTDNMLVSQGHWTDRLRNWLPFLPQIKTEQVEPLFRFDAATGRRLPDGDPAVVVERSDGRPLLTTDSDGGKMRVWANRQGWLPWALATGWTLLLLAIARRLRHRLPASH